MNETVQFQFSDDARMNRFLEQYGRVMRSMMNGTSNPQVAQFSMEIGALFTKAAISNSLDVASIAENNARAYTKYLELSQYFVTKAQGKPAAPAVKPEKTDFRFQSPEWSQNLWFDTLKQSYLIGSEYLENMFQNTDNLNSQEVRKLNFYTQQWVDALSPANYAFTNPDVIEKAVETEGESLIKGLGNLADDLEAGRGVKMVDETAFELGKNIATTPGKVVARNELAELIQYTPTTEQVNEVPILIIPPWINKYYILDLSPKNSFIKWVVDQGYTVFVISWINPDESYRNTKFDNYVELGPIWASQVVSSITGQEKLNAIGYCLGGTLLAALLGYLAGNKSHKHFVKSATFFTSMIDFSEPGDLGVFVDENSVSQLEEDMGKRGYLDGKSMASTFNMMRSNDLIWYFVINNYLLGKQPSKFDLLYWNSDSTRMPAVMHSEYLRKMYLENLLSKQDGMSVLGTPIDLAKVRVSKFFVSTQSDHIAPWKSTYMGAKLFSGRVRFCLGQSGHIAGIINPPTKNKYGYWTSTARLPETADEWFSQANRYEGSWWPEWQKWIKRQSGKKTPARNPGSESFRPIADAPGNYVKL